MGFFILSAFLLLLASIPTIIFWLIAKKILSNLSQLTVYKPTLLALGLAILTGFMLNLELEGGILSMTTQVSVFSLGWSIFLFIALTLIKKRL